MGLENVVFGQSTFLDYLGPSVLKGLGAVGAAWVLGPTSEPSSATLSPSSTCSCTWERLQGVLTGILIGVVLGALGLRHLRRCCSRRICCCRAKLAGSSEFACGLGDGGSHSSPTGLETWRLPLRPLPGRPGALPRADAAGGDHPAEVDRRHPRRRRVPYGFEHSSAPGDSSLSAGRESNASSGVSSQ